MSVEVRHNLVAAYPDHLHPVALPEWPAVRYLERVLDEITGFYFGIEWQAFCEEKNGTYVRVALDLGDRAMYLFICDEGLTLKLEVPVWQSLPKHACHFVLATLCKRDTTFSFRLDTEPTDMLVAHARYDVDAFLEEFPRLLPYIAKQVAQAVAELREYLTRSS